MKTCFKCGISKEIDEFYKHPEMTDGHLGSCKECVKKRVKERYDNDFSKISEYERKRSQNSERKSNALRYSRTHRERYPEKYKARSKLWNAIRDERITKRPCNVCGSESVQAHHDDYNKPLDVEWLCFKHHRLNHGNKNIF